MLNSNFIIHNILENTCVINDNYAKNTYFIALIDNFDIKILID